MTRTEDTSVSTEIVRLRQQVADACQASARAESLERERQLWRIADDRREAALKRRAQRQALLLMLLSALISLVGLWAVSLGVRALL
ncbi:MAG: hypothetical protein M3Y41_07390 [Pseudomonadota bacterium]|nr:hypothetical protein [Pseudomonadota bacterium]